MAERGGDVGNVITSPLGGLHSVATPCSSRYWHKASCCSAVGVVSFPGHTHNNNRTLESSMEGTNLGSQDVVTLEMSCVYIQ